MTSYLNPIIIALTDLDFQKMDIAPGTAAFDSANFAIENFGCIVNLAIVVDRVEQKITKTADSCKVYSDSYTSSLIVSDEGLYSIGALTELKANFNDSFFANSGSSDNILSGAIFSIMVKTIFVDADLDMKHANLDFTSNTIRENNIFFHTDSTSGIFDEQNGIASKTLNAFNNTPSAGTWTDECEYWSYRTEEVSAEETSAVPFVKGTDYIWCLYSLSINFIQENAEGANPVTYESGDLDAITSNGTQVSSTEFTPFSDATVNLKFALQWAIVEPEAEYSYFGGITLNNNAYYTGKAQNVFDNYIAVKCGTGSWIDIDVYRWASNTWTNSTSVHTGANALVSQVHSDTNTNFTSTVAGSTYSSVFVPDIGNTKSAGFFDYNSLSTSSITSSYHYYLPDSDTNGFTYPSTQGNVNNASSPRNLWFSKSQPTEDGSVPADATLVPIHFIWNGANHGDSGVLFLSMLQELSHDELYGSHGVLKDSPAGSTLENCNSSNDGTVVAVNGSLMTNSSQIAHQAYAGHTYYLYLGPTHSLGAGHP